MCGSDAHYVSLAVSSVHQRTDDWCRLNLQAESEPMRREEYDVEEKKTAILGIRRTWMYRAFVPSDGTMIDAALRVMNDVRLLGSVRHGRHGSRVFGDGRGRDDFAPCRTLEIASK